MLYFSIQTVRPERKSNLGWVAGCGLTETVSERSRIGRALEMTFQLFSANFCQMLDGHFAWQAQYLVTLEGDICFCVYWQWRFICDEDQACESFCVAGAVLGEGQVSLFVVGAVLGEVQVSLFVLGAVLGDAQVSLFVLGAVLGEVEVSLCVAGAILGEISKDSLSSKCCIFQ